MRDREHWSGEADDRRRPKEIQIKRDLLREGVVDKSIGPATESADDAARARAALLGRDLAEGLADPAHLGRYVVHAERFPEPLLRRFLSEARAVPAARIKWSRAALFEHLLADYVINHPTREAEDSRA